MTRLAATARQAVRLILPYCLAGAIIWYELSGIPFDGLLSVLAAVNLVWFVPATIVSFAIWFFGENLLFSRMFSYFHAPTSYFELMPATAAAYFLQLINVLGAGGVFVIFLHRRKGAGWLAATVTILFLGFIDGFVLSFLTVLSGLCFPESPLGRFLPYALGVFLALSMTAAWWMWRRPRYRFEYWLRERPSLVSFRTANARIYVTLGFIRLCIFAPQALIYYVAMRAFSIRVPLSIVCAVTPAIVAAGGVPITPVGLGPLQAAAVGVFRTYASTTRIMAVYLALSTAMLLYRVPLGVWAAATFTKLVARNQRWGPYLP